MTKPRQQSTKVEVKGTDLIWRQTCLSPLYCFPPASGLGYMSRTVYWSGGLRLLVIGPILAQSCPRTVFLLVAIFKGFLCPSEGFPKLIVYDTFFILLFIHISSKEWTLGSDWGYMERSRKVGWM